MAKATPRFTTKQNLKKSLYCPVFFHTFWNLTHIFNMSVPLNRDHHHHHHPPHPNLKLLCSVKGWPSWRQSFVALCVPTLYLPRLALVRWANMFLPSSKDRRSSSPCELRRPGGGDSGDWRPGPEGEGEPLEMWGRMGGPGLLRTVPSRRVFSRLQNDSLVLQCWNRLIRADQPALAWAVSQHTDTSKNTKAWAVSHWHQQEHQGLGCVTTHWHQQEHQGLGWVTLTPARTPRLGLGHTDTSKNTKAWAVSQHTDTSKNTKAWAVSQHTDTSKNTKVWAVSHWHQQEHQGYIKMLLHTA